MDLNRISVEARMRSPWQALDLGFVMAKAWWKPLFLSWLIPSASLYFVLTLVFYPQAWIAPWVVWWCKPLFDRAPIYIASRALFDVPTSTRELLKALPKLYTIDCLPWLTWRRFSMSRSYDLPVTVLEGLSGKKCQGRLRQLHQDGANTATWLTTICVHLEGLVLLAVFAFLLLMIPEEVPFFATDWVLMETGLFPLLNQVLSLSAMALIAPFYTMAGFALYINRRIDLEGWDIEISFRDLAMRQKKQSVKHLLVASLLLVLGVLFLSPSWVLAAADESDVLRHPNEKVLSEISLPSLTTVGREAAKTQVLEILEGEDFHKRVMDRGWRLKKQAADKENDSVLPEWFIRFIEFLESNEDTKKNAWAIAVPKILEFLLWMGLAVSAVFLLFRYRKGLDFFRDKARTKDGVATPPKVLFALDVCPEHLPADVPTQVRALWQAGDQRSGLSLLYRATLSKLIHTWGFSFHEGHTEGECLAIVNGSGAHNIMLYTGQLTLHWQALAYGHHVPQGQDLDELLADWRVLFQDET